MCMCTQMKRNLDMLTDEELLGEEFSSGSEGEYQIGIKPGESSFTIPEIKKKRKETHRIPKENGTNWLPEEKEDYYDETYRSQSDTIRKIMERNKNYKFVKEVAGALNYDVEQVYVNEDLMSAARRDSLLRTQQRIAMEELKTSQVEINKVVGSLRRQMKQEMEDSKDIHQMMIPSRKIADKYKDLYEAYDEENTKKKLINILQRIAGAIFTGSYGSAEIEKNTESMKEFSKLMSKEVTSSKGVRKWEKLYDLLLQDDMKPNQESDNSKKMERIKKEIHIELEEYKKVNQTLFVRGRIAKLDVLLGNTNWKEFETNAKEMILHTWLEKVIHYFYDGQAIPLRLSPVERVDALKLEKKHQDTEVVEKKKFDDLLVVFGEEYIPYVTYIRDLTVRDPSVSANDVKEYPKERLLSIPRDVITKEKLKDTSANSDPEKIKTATKNVYMQYKGNKVSNYHTPYYKEMYVKMALIPTQILTPDDGYYQVIKVFTEYMALEYHNLLTKIEQTKKQLEEAEERLNNLRQGKPNEKTIPDEHYRHRREWVEKPENSGNVPLKPIIANAISAATNHLIRYTPYGRHLKNVELPQHDPVIMNDFAELTASCVNLDRLDNPKQYTSVKTGKKFGVKRKYDATARLQHYELHTHNGKERFTKKF